MVWTGGLGVPSVGLLTLYKNQGLKSAPQPSQFCPFSLPGFGLGTDIRG